MFHKCVLINDKAYSLVGMYQKRSQLIPKKIHKSTTEHIYSCSHNRMMRNSRIAHIGKMKQYNLLSDCLSFQLYMAICHFYLSKCLSDLSPHL